MKNEFTKITNSAETRYILESDGGTTSAAAVGSGSVVKPLGGVRRRGDNLLAQEADKNKVPATTPRNFVAKNAKMGGAGQHKDKKKAEKQGNVKHKKPFAEQGVAEGSETPEKELQRLKLRQDAEHGGASLNRQSGTQARIRELEKQIKDKKDQQGVAEGSEQPVSFREMVNVVDEHYPKYYAELSGSDISDKQFERAIVNAYKAIVKKQGVAEGMEGRVVFSGTGANGSKYEIIQTGPTDVMIHANGRHIDTYSSLQRAMGVLKNEVPGLQQGVAEENISELKKSTVKSYADKKQAELDDVPPMPFKKPGMSKDEHEKAAKGMMGALARLSGKKPTSKEQGVAEGFDGEYDDEAGMAHNNLLTSARAVMGLLKTIDDKDNLPEWVQEKIAKAEMMLVGVWDYLQSQKAMGNDPQVDVAEGEKKGLYYYVNKRKKAGTSRPASSPKAPTAQAWKDAAKTAKKEDVAEDDSALQTFLSKGGKVQQLPYKKPRKADKTDYGSRHIGGSGDKMKASRTGTAARTQGNKVAGMAEVSDATKQSYKEKAQAQVRELEPHAKKGEYKDIAQRAIDRRQKGLARVKEDSYIQELASKMAEKLDPNADPDVWVQDFQKADPNKYHQFKNKTPEKKAQMAIAARYAAKQPKSK